MSGLLGSISGAAGGVLSALQNLVGSRSRLLPASFGGVPFYVVVSGGAGGRRLVTHEFPLRDTPSTEDLGKLPRRFKLHAFVIDDPAGFAVYQDLRDALITQCETGGAAVLVHPTFGPSSCRSGPLVWTERVIEAFGYCDFQLDFVVDGPQPSPVVQADTLSKLLGGIASVLPYISAAYNLLVIGLASPAALLGMVGDDLLGLPQGTLLGLTGAIENVFAAPDDTAATAAAVQAVTQGAAANVIAAAQASTAATDAVTGVPFAIAPPADPSGGLAALAAWGNSLPAVSTTTPYGATVAALQAAVVALVQGNAVAALVQVYAQIDWPYAAAAAAARQQVVGLIEAQVDAAADAGSDDLYRAWRGLQAMTVANMIAEAQSLPQLGSYTTADTWPSLALAQALFQDPTQAGALENINDVPHPLFMPVNGLAIVPSGASTAVDLS
jgi:prophage DNA circulation protein